MEITILKESKCFKAFHLKWLWYCTDTTYLHKAFGIVLLYWYNTDRYLLSWVAHEFLDCWTLQTHRWQFLSTSELPEHGYLPHLGLNNTQLYMYITDKKAVTLQKQVNINNLLQQIISNGHLSRTIFNPIEQFCWMLKVFVTGILFGSATWESKGHPRTFITHS